MLLYMQVHFKRVLKNAKDAKNARIHAKFS